MGCGSSKTAEKATSDTSSVVGIDGVYGRPNSEDGYFSKGTEEDYLSRKGSAYSDFDKRKNSRRPGSRNSDTRDNRRFSRRYSEGYHSDPYAKSNSDPDFDRRSIDSQRNYKQKNARNNFQPPTRSRSSAKPNRERTFDSPEPTPPHRRESRYDRDKPKVDRSRGRSFDNRSRGRSKSVTRRHSDVDQRRTSNYNKTYHRNGYDSDPDKHDKRRNGALRHKSIERNYSNNRRRSRRPQEHNRSKRYNKKEEEAAATKIQAGIRGYLTRKRVRDERPKLERERDRRKKKGRHRRHRSKENRRVAPRNIPPPPAQLRKLPEPKSPRVAGGTTRKGQAPPGWQMNPGKGNESKFYSEYVDDFYWS